MRVAVICEFSGIVRDAFIRQGHEAVSCDLLPTEAPGPHIVGDAREHDWSGYDLAICHPPCTYLCNSGVHLLHREPDRWMKMEEAARFFQWCLELPCEMVCVENPIMHKHAMKIVGKYPSQIIQPWQYGHGESKATCLWLKNLPALEPTQIVRERRQRIMELSPSPERWKIRSRTYRGIADAMADQWGDQSAHTLWRGEAMR